MKRLLVLSVLAAPALLSAANVCVLNYDTLDRFLDPVMAESVDCSNFVIEELVAAGHTVSLVNTTLPEDISGYDAVFLLMGWYRC
jgi:hypothetical protein